MVQAKNYCVNWSLRFLPRDYTNDLLGRRTAKNDEQNGGKCCLF